MVIQSSAVRSTAVMLFLAMSAPACQPTRTVKLAWDQPPVAPEGYRILVDDRIVLDIAPPPVNPACKCLEISVPVTSGQHTLKVVAYNANGSSSPSVVTVVK